MYFRPPLDHTLVTEVMKLCSGLISWWRARILRVELTPRAQTILSTLRGPAILAPNHPTHDDPLVMFQISRHVRARYNYVSAYENFEELGPMLAWLLQAVGCYSVVRGTVDRQSFRVTRQLLAQERRIIVIFIEGTAPYQNDSLLPFQGGVVQLGYWALEDVRRAGVELPALPVVPVCIKYAFHGDPMPGLLHLLGGLEEQVLGRVQEAPVLQRVRTLGLGILEAQEEDRQLTGGEEATLMERVERLRRRMLEGAEELAGFHVRPGAPYTDRVFAIRRALDQDLLGEVREAHPYRQLLFEERRQRLAYLQRDVERLTLFGNFYDGYLQEFPSPERIADILDRLHREVHRGRPARLPPRVAHVDCGESVDLVQRLEAYQQDRKGEVASVTTHLQEQMRGLLESLYHAHTRPLHEGGAASPGP